MSDNRTINDEELSKIAGGNITFEPLRKLMEEHGISTETFQEKFNFDPRKLDRLNYNTDYCKKMIERLSKILNMTPSEIIEYLTNNKQ